MSNNNIFKILLILARPAAGKSEILHYLQGLSEEDRISQFHIGKINIIDDFPMIWTWFEEDDLLAKMGFPHLYTDDKGYFVHQYLWDLLVERMNLEYKKLQRDDKNLCDQTVVIEFSRGKEHGGYKSAFMHLSNEILQRSAILYVNTSWAESLRKNRKRFNPKKPDSILEHSIPDEKLAKMYFETDWDEIATPNTESIKIGKTSVPYEVFENEDDVTSGKNMELDDRLHIILDKLWVNYFNKNQF